MKNVKGTIFYVGLALLFTHELDSMPNHEWRLLPILRSLPESVGESTFIIAHIPIFAIVLACIASMNAAIRRRARITAACALVIHAFLHYLFSGNAAYEFSSTLSSILIYGAAMFGAAFLAAELAGQKSDV